MSGYFPTASFQEALMDLGVCVIERAIPSQYVGENIIIESRFFPKTRSGV